MSTAPLAPRREDLPDGSVTIWFSAPILHHGDPKGSLVLRPPCVMDVVEIGDPVTWFFDSAGRGVQSLDRERLKLWFQRLIDGHDADMVGRERDTALGLLIEDAICGFFQNARMSLKPASAP
jgi:hypothetical protein